jgi:crossover junction endodeoxyribonuclease RuvC
MKNKYLKVSIKFDKIILGIDPGTNVLGYGVLGMRNGEIELIDVGQWNMKNVGDHLEKLKRIAQEMQILIDHYKPVEMAIEAPFFGKNVQSMLKLGRAQGVAMTVGILNDLKITEYPPKRVKLAVTGNGNASKEQVAAMLTTLLKKPIINETLDATDALAVGVCHLFQGKTSTTKQKYSGWEGFIKSNPEKIK